MDTLTIKPRYRVEIGRPERALVILVGCGGTGSFLALHLARLAYHVRDRHRLDVQLVFIDHDVVEPKNIGRQNFAPAEIDFYKAQALMLRYNRTFGLSIQSYAQRADAPLLDRIVVEWLKSLHYGQRDSAVRIVCGCVDNADARRVLHDAVSASGRHLWWLDGGNHHHAGQVLIGNRADIPKPQISPLKICVDLPAPSVQCPDLLISPPLGDYHRTGEGQGGGTSCADLALQDVQSLMINQAVAGWMAVYVSRLLVSHDLDIYATYLDQVAGSTRSLGIEE
jgi:PRTRC genetic system ThiF family protein